ncbi:MAG TPA: hypothetical protein VKP13_18400 [Nitrospira sp.]|nr:hypothetical protein [Nitrospira sp.]
MRAPLGLLIGLAVWWPSFAFAEGAGGTYRGIASLYYTLMWGILVYGLYDTFGKTAVYVGAPILAVGIYLMLPPG